MPRHSRNRKPWLAASADRYDPRTKALILAGEKVDLAEYTRLRDELRGYRATPPSVFSKVDVVVLPTLPRTPVCLREAVDPFALDACTFPFSLGGWPALSVPCGFSASGLPVGMLLAGPPLSEPTLLCLAHAYERATLWHGRHPSLNSDRGDRCSAPARRRDCAADAFRGGIR